MSKRTELLSDLARQALAQYDADLKAGGEPVYPQWESDLLNVLQASEQLAKVLRLTRAHLISPTVSNNDMRRMICSTLVAAEAA